MLEREDPTDLPGASALLVAYAALSRQERRALLQLAQVMARGRRDDGAQYDRRNVRNPGSRP
jgi:hypothetical protein